MATALGVGILLDATIVRAVLVPALVSLLGRWNWCLPSRVRQGQGGIDVRRWRWLAGDVGSPREGRPGRA
jgi:uncharacterized membrane protein YdfJ with MMPL/SSD domain